MGACAWGQQQHIACSSQGGKPQACPADTFYGVLLQHENSTDRCVRNRTWRYDTGAIYVSKGCSADFLIHPRRTDPRSSEGYQIQGSGENAFHTNGAIRPGPTGSDAGATDAPKADEPQPK